MKAIELDSSNAEIQYTLGIIAIWKMWDWTRGEEAMIEKVYLIWECRLLILFAMSPVFRRLPARWDCRINKAEFANPTLISAIHSIWTDLLPYSDNKAHIKLK